MAFLLSSENVLTYLKQIGLYSRQAEKLSVTKEPSTEGKNELQIAPKPGKNFNLRVTAPGLDVLVKQEPHGLSGQATGEIAREWAFYQMLADDVGLGLIQNSVLTPLHFDRENAIIVLPYLNDVCDLSEFYEALCRNGIEETLPVEVAIALAKSFSVLHSQTFESLDCYTYWRSSGRHKFRTNKDAGEPFEDMRKPDFLAGLGHLSPEEFCGVPSDALKFFRFYQRYPEIRDAIATLNQSFAPSCIVHDDPRFANVLINGSPEQSADTNATNLQAQLIDWEKWKWGDPAYDLGRLVANYLKLWLKSLPISSQMSLSEALNSATVPLSALQPSLGALMKTYLGRFPEIVAEHPDFVTRVTQFAGLGLIQQVLLYIVHKRPLGNAEMAFVQVAKSLLCQPQGLVATVFGETEEALLADVSSYKDKTPGTKEELSVKARQEVS